MSRSPLRDIPDSFQIFGHTITVKWVDKLEGPLGSDLGAWGLADLESNTIYLIRPKKGVDPEIIHQTFWHEKMHFVFHFLSEHDLKFNEKLVDLVAMALHQSVRTATFAPKMSGKVIQISAAKKKGKKKSVKHRTRK